MMDGPRAESIRDYLLSHYGRAEPHAPNPLFAGRDKALNSMLRAVGRLDRSDVPLANMTALLYGAPGAGKSELLAQLRARVKEADSRPPVVLLSGGMSLLTEAAAVAKAIHQNAPRDIAERVKPLLNDTTWKLGVPGFAGAEWKAATPRSEISRLGEVADCLSRGGRAPTVILMIDEAQDELRDASKKTEHFVRALHKGEAGLKALTVYAGLGTTPVALERFGVTRLDEDKSHLLLRLADDDVRGMAVEALDATTRQHPDLIAEWAGAVVEHAQGWPVHLNHALRAVAERAQAGGWMLGPEEIGQAMRDADDLRTDYYARRLRACPELERAQYTAWATLFGQDGDIWPETIRAHPSLGASRGKGQSDLVEGAVRAGLVESTTDGTLRSPIPSLVDHIARMGRQFERSFGQPHGSDCER